MNAIFVVSVIALAACADSSARMPASPTLRTLYDLPPLSALAPRRTALVLVDFQDEFFHGGLALPDAGAARDHAALLLAWARAAGLQVVHVRNVTRPHSRLFAPESPHSAIVEALAPRPGELVVTKPTGGAFTRTDLESQLRERGVDTLVIAGLMTHLAVAMTAQDAAVFGFQVIVVADACATRALPSALDGTTLPAAVLHRAALTAIADRFADVLTTSEVRSLPLIERASAQVD